MTEQQKRHADMAIAAVGALTKVGKLLPEKVQPGDISRAIHELARERDNAAERVGELEARIGDMHG